MTTNYMCPLCGDGFNMTYSNQLVCAGCKNKPEAIALGDGKFTTGASMIKDPPMKQEADYPGNLAALVERLEYRKGWRFRLCHHDRGQGSIPGGIKAPELPGNGMLQLERRGGA